MTLPQKPAPLPIPEEAPESPPTPRDRADSPTANCRFDRRSNFEGGSTRPRKARAVRAMKAAIGAIDWAAVDGVEEDGH